MLKGGTTYITTNKNKTTLHTGVTADLVKRVEAHKNHKHPDSFSAKYSCEYLVWFEHHVTIEAAIAREKQIKGGSRSRKEKLVSDFNPDWMELMPD